MKKISGRIETFIFADLLATAMLATLAFGTVESWSLAIFEINALIVGVLLAWQYTIDPEFDWRRLGLSLPLWLLLAWALIQIVPFRSALPVPPAPESLPLDRLRLPTISQDPQATREAIAKLLALAIYFTAALHVLRSSRRRQLSLRILAGFGFAVSLFAIVQKLTYNGKMYWFRPVSIYIAPYGPFGNYNHFAGMAELLFPLPFAWLLFTRSKLDERIFFSLATVMLAAAGIFSLSRGGMISMIVQFMALGSVLIHGRIKGPDRAERGKLPLLPVLIVIAVLLVSVWIGYEPLVKRFGTIQQGAGEYSVVTRVEFWRASWRMFLDHPLTGVGLGAFPAVYPSYGSSSSRHERLEQAHNDYLQLLTDAGIVGGAIGLLFLALLFRCWRQQWRSGPSMRSVDRATTIGGTVAVLGILVHSLMDFNLQIASNALLFLFVIAMTEKE